MKKTLIGVGLVSTILSASNFIERLADIMPEPEINFKIYDKTKFKIAENEEAFIVGGSVKCQDDFSVFIYGNSNKMCTKFKNQDGYKFNVKLLTEDRTVINEEWTVKKINKQIQVLRPNGFSIELIKQNMQ